MSNHGYSKKIYQALVVGEFDSVSEDSFYLKGSIMETSEGIPASIAREGAGSNIIVSG